MKIYKDYDFNDLMDACWSGAIDTLNTIQENDKEEELMSLLSLDCFTDTPDLTEVNDLLWFEDEWIFEMLGIDTDSGDDDEDEEEEEDDDSCDDTRPYHSNGWTPEDSLYVEQGMLYD